MRLSLRLEAGARRRDAAVTWFESGIFNPLPQQPSRSPEEGGS